MLSRDTTHQIKENKTRHQTQAIQSLEHLYKKVFWNINQELWEHRLRMYFSVKLEQLQEITWPKNQANLPKNGKQEDQEINNVWEFKQSPE